MEEYVEEETGHELKGVNKRPKITKILKKL